MKFPWGERKIYEPIEVKNNYLLQRSRGIDLEIEDSDEKMREKIKNSIENLVEIDHIRINEIDKVANHLNLKFNKFCEIGFRIPKLQNFYKKRGLEEKGLDINDYNVRLANELGFNCQVFDLNNEDKLDISDCDLIVCYHVLEHLSNPFNGLKKIVSSLKPGSMMHIEIPIEPDGPRLWYGHLYPFHPHDMMKMLNELNLKIFDKIDKTFLKYLKKNKLNIDNTLFI